MNMNRIANAQNRFQGAYKKILWVCSAGLLRSPTAAVVLSSPPFMSNTRAVGLTKEFALIPIDETLLYWADEIVCMEEWQKQKLIDMAPEGKRIINLDIPDKFSYRDPELMGLIKEAYLKEIENE